MPRRKVDKPTTIYWLIDMRPETLARVGPQGDPFYCGKTIYAPEFRLRNHRNTATQFPDRALSQRLIACGDDVRIEIMEVVAVGEKWADRERRWIKILRHSFNALNISDGGDGPAGAIHSTEAREKMSLAKRGKPLHPNARAGAIIANTRREKTSDERAAIGAAHKGKIVSSETRELLRQAKLGRSPSAEARAKQSAAQTGRKLAPEHVAKMKERRHTDHAKEKIRDSLLGIKHSDARRQNISLATKGKKQKPRSPEHCERIAESKRQWWAARKAAEAQHA